MVSTYMSFKFVVCSYLASLNCMRTRTSTMLVYYHFLSTWEHTKGPLIRFMIFFLF